MIDQRVGGRGGGGGAPGGDNGGTAFTDGFAKGAFEPGIVVDDGGGGLAVDGSVGEGGEHGGAVVTVDEDVPDGGEIGAGFFGKLSLGTILIEPDHGGEAVGGEAFGLAGGNHAVGVGGIADDRDAGVLGGDLVNDLALGNEDFSVVFQEVSALHAGSTRFGTDEEAPVGVFEGDGRVAGNGDGFEEGEGAVVEFHGDAFEGLHGFFEGDFKKLEGDGAVRPEHGTGGDAEEEGIGDLTGGTGDGNSDGGGG